MTRRGGQNTGAARAALGFRAHSGWAALVAVTGSPGSPEVLDRRRIELADAGIPGSKQPYHAAEPLELKDAEALLERCAKATDLLARQGLGAVVEDLKGRGHDLVGAGILLASGRPRTSLAATLASHALIHTAEGEFFRNALIKASESLRLPVTRVKERELFAQAEAELRVHAQELERRLNELGRQLGPPWRQDEKFATLAAWLALASASQRKSRS